MVGVCDSYLHKSLFGSNPLPPPPLLDIGKWERLNISLL